MANNRSSTGAALGLQRVARPFMGIAALVLAGIVAPLPAAQAASSYSFAGLPWGASPREARAVLRKRGFKLSRQRVGPMTEYVRMNAWLDIRKVDRGKRMTARGVYLGQRVEVDLVFGFNDRLERVNLRTPLWDGTPKGAKRMTRAAERLVARLERRFGSAAKKVRPFGFTDTANWGRASDGSRMEMYIRGTKGFMFFPKYKTSMNVNFWNPKFQGSPPAMAARQDPNAALMLDAETDR